MRSGRVYKKGINDAMRRKAGDGQRRKRGRKV